MKKNYLVITGIIATVVLIATMALAFLPGNGTNVSADPSLVLDHFKGYKILNPIPVQDPIVVLQDEFDQKLQTKELKIVGPGDMFFDPVEKTVIAVTGNVTTPIVNKADYLERFPISNIPKTPPEKTQWNVVVNNQFGLQQSLKLGPATHILVPNINAAGNLPQLDHFKWYPVINQGKPMNIQLTLRDNFGNWTNVAVLAPVAFANPVLKSHLLVGTAANTGASLNTVPITDPIDHIVAYSIRLIPRLITQPTTISNQFVTSKTLELQEGRVLLVPSIKVTFNQVPTPPNPPGPNPNEPNDAAN